MEHFRRLRVKIVDEFESNHRVQVGELPHSSLEDLDIVFGLSQHRVIRQPADARAVAPRELGKNEASVLGLGPNSSRFEFWNLFDRSAGDTLLVALLVEFSVPPNGGNEPL